MKATYIQIQETIIDDIKAKKLLPGDKISSEHELARQFGVTRSTAKRALDNLTQQGIISRVQGLGTFVSENPNGTLSHISEKQKTIWFLFSKEREFCEESYHFEVYMGAEEEEKKRNFRLQLSTISNNSRPSDIIRDIKNNYGVDGVIVSSPIDELIYSEISKHDIPLILYGHPGSSDYDVVLPDNTTGAYDLTTYLIQQGHKRIAFYHISGDPRFQERYEGFRRAIEEYRCDYILWIDEPFEKLSELAKQTGVTAIFAGNDAVAVNIIFQLNNAGIKIPDHISVVGFDKRTFEHIQGLDITSVDFQKKEMGKLLARILLDRMKNPDSPHFKALMPTRLHVGKTTRAI